MHFKIGSPTAISSPGACFNKLCFFYCPKDNRLQMDVRTKVCLGFPEAANTSRSFRSRSVATLIQAQFVRIASPQSTMCESESYVESQYDRKRVCWKQNQLHTFWSCFIEWIGTVGFVITNFTIRETSLSRGTRQHRCPMPSSKFNVLS